MRREYLTLNRRNTSIMMLVAASFFWGSTFLFTKILIDDMSVYCILFGRSFLAAIFLYLVYFRIINKEIKKALLSKLMWFFAISAFLALALQTEGLQYTTATNSAFITALFIVFIPVIKIFIYKERLKLYFWLAIILALTGLYIISFGFTLPDSLNPGDVFTVLCALFYAFTILLLEKLSVKFSEGSITFFYFTLQTLIALFITIKTGNIQVYSNLSYAAIYNLLALGILGSFIPYLLMAKGQQYVKAQVASIIYNLEPVSATFLAYLFIHEALTIPKVTGCTIIFIALIIGTRK